LVEVALPLAASLARALVVSVDANRALPARAMPDVRVALRLLAAEALITGLDIILRVLSNANPVKKDEEEKMCLEVSLTFGSAPWTF